MRLARHSNSTEQTASTSQPAAPSRVAASAHVSVPPSLFSSDVQQGLASSPTAVLPQSSGKLQSSSKLQFRPHANCQASSPVAPSGPETSRKLQIPSDADPHASDKTSGSFLGGAASISSGHDGSDALSGFKSLGPRSTLGRQSTARDQFASDARRSLTSKLPAESNLPEHELLESPASLSDSSTCLPSPMSDASACLSAAKSEDVASSRVSEQNHRKTMPGTSRFWLLAKSPAMDWLLGRDVAVEPSADLLTARGMGSTAGPNTPEISSPTSGLMTRRTRDMIDESADVGNRLPPIHFQPISTGNLGSLWSRCRDVASISSQ